MKAFVLKYDCDSFDFSCSTNLKVFLIKERAKETKDFIECLFRHYAFALIERLKERDKAIHETKVSAITNFVPAKSAQSAYDEINKLYAKDSQNILNEFHERSGEFKTHFNKEHLALHEEYSFCIEEVEFEG
jgi:hypothetical protein